jgi:recombinational DNA repair ATPase RecF
MQVVKLSAQNFKRLEAVEITPDESGMVVIGGRNAQGKSSVLDAIMAALGGRDAAPEEPIRHGEDQATITVDLGKYVVERTFGRGEKLVVKGREGERFSSPQALLDKITGSLTFDPLEFSRAKHSSQIEMLRRVVGLDFTMLNERREKTYARRTEVNRERDRLRAQAASATFTPDLPEQEIVLQDLVDRRDQMMERARETNAARTVIANLRRSIAEWREKIAAAEQQIITLEPTAAAEVPDVSSLASEIANAQATNKLIRQNYSHRTATDAAQRQQKVSDELTAEIEAIDREKADMIARAKMPVEGLSLSEDGVTYRGVPFSQASAAEKLRVSVAMGLAMNPTLRVMLIRDGSLLDDESLKLLATQVKDGAAQLWIERVGHGEECSIIIEDGRVQEPQA